MSDWKSFAEKLGLRYEKRSRLTGHEIITGLVDGRSVSATFVPGETEHVRVRAFITPALDLGIDVGLLTQLPLLSTTKTGHPRFDDSFRLRADEPERAKQLLTEEVRNAITACESLFHTAIELSDDSMGALGLWPLNSDHSAVVGRMQLVARVAAAVEVARRHVPVATALRAHEAAWEAFADSMNLELLRCPLGIQGKMSGHSFSASVARRRKNAYGFDVRVELAQPLGLDLEIRPASLWEKASELFGRGDVKLDDPAFDAAMHVATRDPERLASLLGPEVRATLLALQNEVGPISLDDTSITLHGSDVGAPTDLPSILDRLGAAASTLAVRTNAYR